VTVTGTNFLSGATMSLGGVAATGVTWLSSTQMRGTTGAHAAGPINVVVTNPGGQSSILTNGFTYTTSPTISSVSPASGPKTGGTVVTVTGANFASGATLTFGGVAATGVTWLSSTQIRGTAGAHAPGVVDVVVMNPDGQSGTLVKGYTYLRHRR
jgi:hypothetical protein